MYVGQASSSYIATADFSRAVKKFIENNDRHKRMICQYVRFMIQFIVANL